jgi:hypothetical protein
MTRRRKKHRPDEIVAKLRDADAMLNAGKDLAAVLQALEVSDSTLERWRAQYGGIKCEEAKRLKGTPSGTPQPRVPPCPGLAAAGPSAGDSGQAVAPAGRWLYSRDIRGLDSTHGSMAESGERGAQRGTQA